MTDVKHNTDAAVRFLKARQGFPVITTVRVDKVTGQQGAVITRSFPGFHDDAKVEANAWAFIESAQGEANVYYSINPTINPEAKKASRENIARVVSFHIDLDPRPEEDQDEALVRLTKELQAYRLPPTWIIASGGGVQGIWDLRGGEPIDIDGNLDRAEDAKLHNVQLERELGGDNCHNIDRIMRLPGTVNCPNTKKRSKGRRYAAAYIIKHTNVRYSVSDFPKATKVQDASERAADMGGSGTNRIEVNVPTNVQRVLDLFTHDETKNLKSWVIRVLMDGYDAQGEKTWKSRSEAVFACACEMVRSDVSDEVMYAIFTDPDYKISESVLTKKNVEREVTRVIGRAREFALDPDLAGMNAKHAVLPVGGKTRVLTWEESQTERGTMVPRYQAFDDFRNLHMNRRKMILEVDEKTGDTKTKNVPLGAWWIAHPQRRQFEGLCYRPDEDSDVVGGMLNLWTGFIVPAIKGDKHKSMLEHMLRNLCRGNEEHYDYLIKWCATVVQKRHEHTGVAVVLKSEGEGTGKGVFARAFGSLFGKHYRHITNPEHLIGKFNAHLQACSLVFADEAFFAGDKRHESILKTIITEPTIIIEPKGVDATSVQNFINMIVASNNAFVVPAGPTARRFFVLEAGTEQMQNEAYFLKIMDDMANGGRSHLLHYLMSVDLTGFNVRNVPKTDALQEQKAFTRSGIDALIETIAQGAVVPWHHHRNADTAITTGTRRGDGFWPWAKDNFQSLRHSSPESMMHTLKTHWECKRFTSGGQAGIIFPPLHRLRELFDQRHGKQKWDSTATSWMVASTSEDRPGDPVRDDIPF